MDQVQSIEMSTGNLEKVEEMCQRLIEKIGCHSEFSEQENDLIQPPKHVSKISEESLKECLFSNPENFLQKYKTLLTIDDIECFNNISNNSTIVSYIKDICDQANLEIRTNVDKNKTYISQVVKNRRFKAMEKLVAEGEHFSLVNLKKRYPKLFDQYIGRFLSTEEKEEMLKLQVKNTKYPNTLSSWLIEIMDHGIEKEDQANNNSCEEEFDSESEDEYDNEQTSQDKAMLKEEFLSKIYCMFLNGEDKDFEYSSVDNNCEYDSIQMQEQDSEDLYFDDEKPSDMNENLSNESNNDNEEDELDAYMKEIQAQI